jgi:hypothetical protein
MNTTHHENMIQNEMRTNISKKKEEINKDKKSVFKTGDQNFIFFKNIVQK